MKILFLTKYTPKGASSRYRSYQYKKWLEAEGIEVAYLPLFNDSYFVNMRKGRLCMKNIIAFWCILRRMGELFFYSQKYDHIVIEKELFPKLPLWVERFFLKRMKSFSLDYDDNISANYAKSCLKNKIPQLMKMARYVTVGNRWYVEHFEGNLIYLPTVVDLEKYPLYQHSQNDENQEIVWVGSSYNAKNLKQIEKTLIKLAEKYHFTLKIIGENISLDKRIKTKFVKWNSSTENGHLAESSIGIMPLEDTYWERGKCGLKLIQYMASGIPVVASSLPANKEIVTEKVGFIAHNEQEWYEKLEQLLKDQALRKKMGQEGRKRVEEHYSYQVWANVYIQILKNTRNYGEN